MNSRRHILKGIGLIILTILFSCNNNNNNNDYEYSKFGIKFSLPDKWFVMSVDSTNDGAYSIDCSAKGDDITKVTINIENIPLDTAIFGKKVRTYKENMSAFSPKFTDVQTSTFNGNPSFKFGFNASTQFFSSLNVKGYIESFQLKNKTITILVMQKIDEKNSDNDGLARLLKSIQLDS